MSSEREREREREREERERDKRVSQRKRDIRRGALHETLQCKGEEHGGIAHRHVVLTVE